MIKNILSMYKDFFFKYKHILLEFLMIFICYTCFEVFFYTSSMIIEKDDWIIFPFVIPSVIISFIIHYLIYYVLKNITKKPILSEIINLSIIYVLALISIIKISYMEMPILISDINFLSGISEVYGLVNFSDIVNILTKTGIVFIFLGSVFISVVSLWFFSKGINKKCFWLKSIVSIICLVILLVPSVFNKITINYATSINQIYAYTMRGFYCGLYGEYLKEQITEPTEYNLEIVENVLNNNYIKNKNDANWGKPNVIFVLSEAFWDINKIDDKIKFDKNVMEDFYQISDNSQLINMISPSYAGMTTNIEYEIMTGNSMRYFNYNFIPFNSIYMGKKSSNLPSIVKFFNNEGYDTTIISPFDNGDIYNVKNAYKYLGFKNIVFRDDLIGGKEKGGTYSDEYIYSLIPEKIKSEDENVFMFVKTSQNHMPYENDKYSENDFDINVISSEASDEDTNILKIYAQGLYDANKSLKQLYDEIQNIEEDTIVIYFGDHLPSLNNSKGEDILSVLNYYKKSQNYKENVFAQYNTQAIIFSNYDINRDDFKYLSFDGLSAYILHNLNIKTDNYFEWLYSNLNDYTGGNFYISSDVNGNLYLPGELSKEQRNVYKHKEFIQYYILNNY